MVYKLGNYTDMQSLPALDLKTEEILFSYTSVLSYEYGEDRNVDEDDGGFVLYAPPGTDCEEIKAYFDYSKYILEYVDVFDEVCSALYLLSNDYGVVIVMSIVDAPDEIKKEMDEED